MSQSGAVFQLLNLTEGGQMSTKGIKASHLRDLLDQVIPDDAVLGGRTKANTGNIPVRLPDGTYVGYIDVRDDHFHAIGDVEM